MMKMMLGRSTAAAEEGASSGSSSRNPNPLLMKTPRID